MGGNEFEELTRLRIAWTNRSLITVPWLQKLLEGVQAIAAFRFFRAMALDTLIHQQRHYLLGKRDRCRMGGMKEAEQKQTWWEESHLPLTHGRDLISHGGGAS